MLCEAWDYEWTHTSGTKLEDDTATWYLDKSASGPYTELTADGEVFHTPNTTYYQMIVKESSGLRYMTGGYGVVEVELVGSGIASSADRHNFRITAAENGSVRVTVFPAAGKWRLLTNADQVISCPALANYSDGVPYTLRIEMHGTYADIYLNGVLIDGNRSLSATVDGKSNQLFATRLGSGTITLKSFKLKVGRV